MTNGITDLDVFHEVPYSNIKGAYVKIKQKMWKDSLMIEDNPDEVTTIEKREGTIVGRGNGQGVAYDRQEKDCKPISIGPSIYIETPEDTILEVRTDKCENELLEFEPEESNG